MTWGETFSVFLHSLPTLPQSLFTIHIHIHEYVNTLTPACMLHAKKPSYQDEDGKAETGATVANDMEGCWASNIRQEKQPQQPALKRLRRLVAWPPMWLPERRELLLSAFPSPEDSLTLQL